MGKLDLGAKLIRSIEKIAKEQKAAEKAGNIEAALEKNKELKLAIQSGVNDPAMPRAKPLSEAQIQAFAERMAPQVEGKLTRGKTGAKTVAGKTQKQFEREKTLPVQRRVVTGQRDPMEALPELTLEQQKGGVLLGLPGDPTLARMELSGIGDVAFERPVTLYGGPRYGDQEKLWASNISGASNLVGAGRRASEQYGGAPVFASYMKMPEGFGFAQHYLDSLLQYTRPDQLPKAARLALEEDIRKGFVKGKKKYEFPEFAGFDDLDTASQQALMDSNLRGHIADRLEKGKTYGLRPAGDVQFAVTHPELTNIETGAGGFTIGELPLNEPFSSSAHPTYTHDIPGKVLGQTQYPTPYDLLYRDQLDLVTKNPTIADEPFGTVKLLGARQTIDEQLINEINEYQERMRRLIGKKKGGQVKMAEGGDVAPEAPDWYAQLGAMLQNPEPTWYDQLGEMLMAEGGSASLKDSESRVGLAPYGLRHSGQGAKGSGYFGPMRGREGVVTELSAEDDEGEYPLVVPTLTKEEIDLLLSGGEPTEEIHSKAKSHAEKRKGAGKSPFAGSSELRYPMPTERGYADGGQTFPLKDPEEEQRRRMMEGSDIRVPQKHPTLVKVGEGIKSAHEFISKPFGYENPPGEFVSELLGIPAVGKTLENIGYDMPLTTGAGMTSNLRPEVAEAALTALPIVGKAGQMAAKAAPKVAKKATETLAPTVADLLETQLRKSGMIQDIIKPKGGNWLNESSGFVPRRVKSETTNWTPEEAEGLGAAAASPSVQRDIAISKWIDKKLHPYIKNEMGTESDPIRLGIERRAAEAEKLKETNQAKIAKMEVDIARAKAAGKDTTLSEGDLEKAREKFADEEYIASEGLFHGTIPEEGWASRRGVRQDEILGRKRARAGMPIETTSTHPAAQQWERRVDSEIEAVEAGKHLENEYSAKHNPWLAKLDPSTQVYNLDSYSDSTFEFRHMIDEIKEAMDPNSVLPKSLRIAPKDLEKMTIDDVSALSGKISAWRNVQKTKSDLQIANNPATQTFKEYPLDEANPKGVSWRQIKKPEGYSEEEAEKFVRDATKYEGDIMRHCVGGAGHCEPLLRGDVELYTLRDAKGEPHVTIEVEPAKKYTEDDVYEQFPGGVRDAAKSKTLNQYIESKLAELNNKPSRILEIKGKNNRKPSPEYIPFVQDFVKSGKFSSVGDSAHAEMYQPNPSTLSKFLPENPELQNIGQAERLSLFNKAQEAGDLNSYLTRDDWENILLKYAKQKGYVKGGAVHMAKGGSIKHHKYSKELQKYAEGGTISDYNTSPDIFDSGQMILEKNGYA